MVLKGDQIDSLMSTQLTTTASAESEALESIATNRQILREVSELYARSGAYSAAQRDASGRHSRQGSGSRDTAPGLNSGGLKAIAEAVNITVGPIQRKAAVMIIGNISAGKSTFINWYVQEAVQRTGMAIETSGFTYVTSGRCVNELGGESTLAQRPYLQKYVARYKGFLENLSLKTCPSRDGRLQLVDLIDTPGLADGELQYPFNVEELIVELRHHVDLYFVFFDPIGQALGGRVLSVVKKLSDFCPDKLRFCLTKVDDVRTEEERIKILCQTTQSLTAKINSRHGFDLIPLYVPGAKTGTYILEGADTPAKKNSQTMVNRIWDLVSEINRVTERKVQDSLNCLNNDAAKLTAELDRILAVDAKIKSESKAQEWRSCRRAALRSLVLFTMFVFGFVHLRATGIAMPHFSQLDSWVGQTHSHAIMTALDRTTILVKSYYLAEIVWTCLAVCLAMTFSFKSSSRVKSLSKQDLAIYTEQKEFLRYCRKRCQQLNTMYLEHKMDDALTQLSA